MGYGVVSYGLRLDRVIPFGRTIPVARSAVVLRILHCVGDGMRLLGMLQTMLRFKDGSPSKIPVLQRILRGVGKRTSFFNPWVVLRDFLRVLALPTAPLESPTCIHKGGEVSLEATHARGGGWWAHAAVAVFALGHMSTHHR